MDSGLIGRFNFEGAMTEIGFVGVAIGTFQLNWI